MAQVRGKLFQLTFIGCLVSFTDSLIFGMPEYRLFTGELFPADPMVCTTQSVTFTSKLTEEPVTNYSIGFTIKTKETQGKFVTVDYNKTIVINEMMAEYVHDVPPLKELETANYFFVKSYYWQEFGDDDKTLQIGKTTSARVYPYPKKVIDFDCIVRNYDIMTCSWKYGVHYGIHIPEVIFKWRIPSYTSSWTDCRYIDIEEGFCIWNETKAGVFQYSNITMRITLKQKCNVNVTSEFHVDTSKIVKPNPVSSTKVNVINSTCVTLLWNTTESGQYHPKEHLVIVSSRGDYIMNATSVTTIETERLEHRETFCGLHPYTEYSFTVRIKPTGIYSGFLSDPVQITAKTYSDIPSRSPELTDGGYSLNHRDCEDGREKRRVCLFWKPIKAEDENGQMLGLQGQFSACPLTSTKHEITENWAEDVTYGCSNILCDTSYLFTIKGRNVNGTSIQASTISIPAFAAGTVRPNFIVESTNHSDVHISWTYTGRKRARSFLVAWCRNENGECKPVHKVGWKHVNASSTEVIIRIDMPQDYLYGVSALIGENDSTGVELKDCVYMRDSLPKREPQNVVVSTGAEDNSLIVTWDKLACTSNEPYITMYNIQYYKENDEQRKSINVSQSGKARLVLTNLKEDQSYVLTVRGVTKHGIFGPESQPQIGVPVNKSLKPPEIVGITMAVLVCVIFAGIGVFCAVRRCKRKAQNAIKQAGNITIPDVPEPENSTSLLRKNSKDSGFDQTPPSDKTDINYKLRSPSLNLPYDYQCVIAGVQNDTNVGTGSSKCPPSYASDNSKNIDLLNGLYESGTSKGKKGSELRLNIPKPITLTPASELYLCNQGKSSSVFSQEKRIDCEGISKSLGCLLDTNHNGIPCIHVMSSGDIPNRNKENDNVTTLDLDTTKSNSCFQLNDQYIINSPCRNEQMTADTGLNVDEHVSVFTIDKHQEIDDDNSPYIDTCNLSIQCQECDQNKLSTNLSGIHGHSHVPDFNYVSTTDNKLLQTFVMQTIPVPESVNSVRPGSITPPPQDFGSDQGQEPTSPPSITFQSDKTSNFIADTALIPIPEEVKQGNDHAVDLDKNLLQKQLLSKIKYFVEPVNNERPVSSFEDDILFSSKQDPEITDTNGYVSHFQTGIEQTTQSLSQHSPRETCQEATTNTKQYGKEHYVDNKDYDETKQSQMLNQMLNHSFV